MDRGRILIAVTLAGVLACVTAFVLLVIVHGCATVQRGDPWERHYDPNYGREKEDILKHFNLHRGRWWNYYDRGSVYMAYGHYQEALSDFETAAGKRGRDVRDARMYGMHFIDYFPHRESGVAYYYRGESATSDDLKQQHYKDAIRELEISLQQAESARAKYYLNGARSALWQVTRTDTMPPTIRVKRPIYTNRRTVRFNIIATDCQSGVGAIRIAKSIGDVRIRRPELLVELARQEVTATAEFSLGPRAKYATVAVTAADLAGNASEPNMALIVLDTQAPTARISVIKDRPMTGGQVAVSIQAHDNFGLAQIKVGEYPVTEVQCEDKPSYSGTVVGMPREGELTIELADSAGNTTRASVPVEFNAPQAVVAASLLSAAPLPLSQGSFLSELPWKQALRRPALPGLSSLDARHPMHVYRAVNPNIQPLSMAWTGDSSGRMPKFKFHDYVKPYRGGAKETCESIFAVEGELRNPLDIYRIKVQLNEQEQQQVWDPWKKKPQDDDAVIFNLLLDLGNVPIGKPQTVTVEAYRKLAPTTPVLPQTLRITKVEDASREAKAIYGILVLPLRDLSAPLPSGWDTSKLSRIYEDLVEQLKSLPMPYRSFGDESMNAFRIYHITEVYEIASAEAWYKLSAKETNEGAVVGDLRSRRTGEISNKARSIEPTGVDPNLIDLVVAGSVKVNKVDIQNQEGITITLWATDVLSNMLLKFRDKARPGERDSTLAEMFCGAEEIQEEMWKLVGQVPVCIPRLQEEVEASNSSVQDGKQTLSFELGEEEGAFVRMKFWLYEKDTLKNAKLTKVGCLDLTDIESHSSRIECDQSQTVCHDPGCRHVVITK